MKTILHGSTRGNALTAKLKKLWKNDYVQTAVIIGLIALIVMGVWFSVQMVLNTPDPALAVVSGSMCIPEDAACDGWTHPFARTLHIGDLIIIQGVNPADLNADYPNSDIIVFHKPTDPNELIVHRIVKEEIGADGKIYFYTKGDGNPVNKWPDPIQPSEYDPWGRVSEDLVVGKVIMRIPWVGHVVLFMRNSVGLPIVIGLIVALLFIEFIAPLLKKKRTGVSETEQPEEAPQEQQEPML
jgi:signal peptidase I